MDLLISFNIAFQIYLVLGVCLWLWSLFGYLNKKDPMTKHTSLWFKLIILPGFAILWPFLFISWSNKSKA